MKKGDKRRTKKIHLYILTKKWVQNKLRKSDAIFLFIAETMPCLFLAGTEVYPSLNQWAPRAK